MVPRSTSEVAHALSTSCVKDFYFYMNILKKGIIIVLLPLVGAVIGYLVFYYQQSNQICMAVVTPARNMFTKQCQYFPSPCQIPPIFYSEDNSCENTMTLPE